MFDIDKTPETNEEKNELLMIVANQQFQVSQCRKVMVTCHCGKKIRITSAYRCFYCGVYFCFLCAKRHFKIEHNCKHGEHPTQKSAGAERSAGLRLLSDFMEVV
ncbi:MAG: hypothetical protein A2031_08085 [Deltaproteobacteria bacterium RBG_19FT_COMBO_43_11]|nr:MAG: hypothetical protein A2031_08085 [Deltaproteobacteria bacterium RBG_19FT_COMBO_43_11]